ncbi:Protein serine/threonine phosphatase PrpC, regulation of stationary phase [Olavius algarvensis associated proteobacterium Delta 3]|nr:Protein serine/threonine phosphatase PrpC, regulation of stationary phase [Olavius algarvensis associated proteobacterium Delta 3]CAB5124606.1 Protein serine/threonine phosphatase PrpC, regulation of stationary phase [Olavius algarvensis associated proteobacterium Delta 3]
MLSIQSAGITDVGRKRKGNEDAYHLDNDLRLFIVADGMGGHAAGEVASRLVVDSVVDFMTKFHAHPARNELPTSATELSPSANLLLNAVHMANRVVHQNAQQKPAYKGMGSTVSAVYLADDSLIAVNVGDSPIYLVQDQSIRSISVPHTMLAEYEDLHPEGNHQLAAHLKHVLTRAMGLRESVTPDVSEVSLSNDAIVVICSDGLSDKVPPDEICSVVTREPPSHAGSTLVGMANNRGGEDNITIIIARLTTESAAAPEDSGDTGKPIRIAVDYDTEEVSNQGFVTQISDAGVFIETADPIALGEEISVTFSGTGEIPAFLFNGRVCRRDPKGMEICFDHLTEDQRTRLAILRNG